MTDSNSNILRGDSFAWDYKMERPNSRWDDISLIAILIIEEKTADKILEKSTLLF